MSDKQPGKNERATEQMQPHLDRTARELADLEQAVRDNQTRTTGTKRS